MKLTQEARKFKPHERLRWPNLICKTRRPGKAEETINFCSLFIFYLPPNLGLLTVCSTMLDLFLNS
jgi:hypothetical protein